MYKEARLVLFYIALVAKVNLSRNIFWPPLKESFNRMKRSDDDSNSDNKNDNDRTDMGEI